MNISGKRFFKKTVLVAVVGLSLAACQPKEKIDPRAGGGGLVGNWVSADNIFTANLNNGSFIATANDTGETISNGSYIVVSSTRVDLKWRGNVTKQDNSATCQRPDERSMQCTDATGKSFSLIKSS